MIKHLRPASPADPDPAWRDLDEAVAVELTSEDPDHPIEHALLGDTPGAGWRARMPGPQTITITWPEPIAIRRIQLVFDERAQARTQEFVLRARTSDGVRDIVRQQFTFAPPGTTVEREEYAADIEGVTDLELSIVPTIGGGDAVATLRRWRIG